MRLTARSVSRTNLELMICLLRDFAIRSPQAFAKATAHEIFCWTQGRVRSEKERNLNILIEVKKDIISWGNFRGRFARYGTKRVEDERAHYLRAGSDGSLSHCTCNQCSSIYLLLNSRVASLGGTEKAQSNSDKGYRLDNGRRFGVPLHL